MIFVIMLLENLQWEQNHRIWAMIDIQTQFIVSVYN